MTAAAVTSGTFAGSLTVPLDISITAPPWMRTGEYLPCLDDPEIFFPEGYGLKYRKQVQAAKELCLGCPVRLLCLNWAVPQADLDGVWGAATPPERRRLRTGTNQPRRTA